MYICRGLSESTGPIKKIFRQWKPLNLRRPSSTGYFELLEYLVLKSTSIFLPVTAKTGAPELAAQNNEFHKIKLNCSIIR